jgi:hypothetical protein
VLHHHPETWRHYARQQRGYGIGYAQLLLHYSHRFPWAVATELRAWQAVAGAVARAARRGPAPDVALLRRGSAVKLFAQRVGFASTYWSPAERRGWPETQAGRGPDG